MNGGLPSALPLIGTKLAANSTANRAMMVSAGLFAASNGKTASIYADVPQRACQKSPAQPLMGHLVQTAVEVKEHQYTCDRREHKAPNHDRCGGCLERKRCHRNPLGAMPAEFAGYLWTKWLECHRLCLKEFSNDCRVVKSCICTVNLEQTAAVQFAVMPNIDDIFADQGPAFPAPVLDRLEIVAGKVVATMNKPSAAQKRFNTLVARIDDEQAQATKMRHAMDTHARCTERRCTNSPSAASSCASRCWCFWTRVSRPPAKPQGLTANQKQQAIRVVLGLCDQLADARCRSPSHLPAVCRNGRRRR